MPRMTPYADPLSAGEHVQLGQSYAAQHDDQAAGLQYEQALKKDRHYIPALLAMGDHEFAAGRPKDALPFYKKVLSQKPDHAGAQNNIAVVYLALGNLKKAEVFAQRASESAALRPYAMDTLSQIELRRAQTNK